MLFKIMCRQVTTLPIASCYETGRISFQLKLCIIFEKCSVWSNNVLNLNKIHCRYGSWKYKKNKYTFFSNPEIDGTYHVTAVSSWMDHGIYY